MDYVLYQVGALMGVASRFGVELSHVQGRHGDVASLSPQDINDLCAYVLSL